MTGQSEGWGEAHVAEWRRVGAKRVLGDMGRGGGSFAGVERSEADRVSAAMSWEAARRGGIGMWTRHGFLSGTVTKGRAAGRRDP